jgi:hypothetical protein
VGLGNFRFSIFDCRLKRALFSLLLGGLLSAFAIAWLAPLPHTVEAQNTGTVQLAVRIQTSSITLTSGAPSATVTIGSVSQVGHLLSFVFSGISSGTSCHVQFIGSNNNFTNSLVIAGGVSTVAGATVSISTNGYFPYLEVIANTEGYTGCAGTFTLNYTGFATSIPVYPSAVSSFDVTSNISSCTSNSTCTSAIGTSLGLTNIPGGPYIWQGLQCSNPNASAVWIQLFDKGSSPTLGTTVPFYTTQIPASSNWSYPGLPISNENESTYPWIAATTTRTGGTVATGVSCMAQMNYIGPFNQYAYTNPL